MNNKDLSVIIEDVKLNIRVGLIIKYDNKILIEKNKNVDFAVVPGGRVKTLESTHSTLLREISEELGIDISNEKTEMISLIENFFVFDNTKYHELYFLYKVELSKDYNLKDGMNNLDNNDSSYYLLTNEQFQNENILPNVLKEIVNINEFKHYVVNDLN